MAGTWRSTAVRSETVAGSDIHTHILCAKKGAKRILVLATFPAGLTSIGHQAFCGCSALARVTSPLASLPSAAGLSTSAPP